MFCTDVAHGATSGVSGGGAANSAPGIAKQARLAMRGPDMANGAPPDVGGSSVVIRVKRRREFCHNRRSRALHCNALRRSVSIAHALAPALPCPALTSRTGGAICAFAHLRPAQVNSTPCLHPEIQEKKPQCSTVLYLPMKLLCSVRYRPSICFYQKGGNGIGSTHGLSLARRRCGRIKCICALPRLAGTDVGATMPAQAQYRALLRLSQVLRASCLHARYAMPGTDLASSRAAPAGAHATQEQVRD
eukprot:2867378-Rhodomonas_salina.2